ncbi:MAG: hypothetical protein ACI8T1_002606, partial [Verrucomicrobiales bacterium]
GARAEDARAGSVAWLGGSTRRGGIAHSENGTQPAHPHELTQISMFSQK